MSRDDIDKMMEDAHKWRVLQAKDYVVEDPDVPPAMRLEYFRGFFVGFLIGCCFAIVMSWLF